LKGPLRDLRGASKGPNSRGKIRHGKRIGFSKGGTLKERGSFVARRGDWASELRKRGGLCP